MDDFLCRLTPHLRGLRNLVSIRMRGTGLTEDLLQETLLAAWIHREEMRTEEAFRPWLFEIARNKCNDAYRRLHREVPMARDALEARLGPRGRDDPQEAAWEIDEGIARLPEREREIVRRFYLDDRTIQDIAAASGLPEGTVKRRLHDARARLRAFLREPHDWKGCSAMKTECPLPRVRPKIAIEPLQEPAFEVECPESLWMFESVHIGETLWFGTYDAPDWHLTQTYRAQTLREARVHGVDGVEVRMNMNDCKESRRCERYVYLGIVEGQVRTLAERHEEETGRIVFASFLDPAFDDNWNSGLPMRMRDEGRFERTADGGYRTVKTEAAIGAGMVRVRIGEKEFKCLRVLDAQDGMLIEGFMLKDGHTALARRYNDPMWKVGPGGRYETPWDVRYPDHARLYVDGVKYVHWYDCIGGVAL